MRIRFNNPARLIAPPYGGGARGGVSCLYTNKYSRRLKLLLYNPLFPLVLFFNNFLGWDALCPSAKRGDNTIGAIKITAGLDFDKRASAVDWLRGLIILSEAKDLCRVVLVSGQRFFTTLRSVQNDSLEVFYNLLIILRHKNQFPADFCAPNSRWR